MSRPVVYEPGDPMPDEFREVLVRLLRVHADTEASVIFPETDWIRDHITFAPTAEDRVIEAGIYADEMRHGLLFAKLLREVGIEVSADYFRRERSLDSLHDRGLHPGAARALQCRPSGRPLPAQARRGRLPAVLPRGGPR